MEKLKREIVAKQLGRNPDNLKDIVVYCSPSKKPAVVLTSPFSSDKGIFPTIYWLSCPYLVEEIFRIEDKGLVKKLTEKLKSDSEFKKEMMKTHEKYAERRLSMLLPEEIKKIKDKSKDMYKVIKESGVGGIMDKGGIKCLHAHYADYLVNGDNPAGKIISDKISWPKCCSCGDDS